MWRKETAVAWVTRTAAWIVRLPGAAYQEAVNFTDTLVPWPAGRPRRGVIGSLLCLCVKPPSQYSEHSSWGYERRKELSGEDRPLSKLHAITARRSIALNRSTNVMLLCCLIMKNILIHIPGGNKKHFLSWKVQGSEPGTWNHIQTLFSSSLPSQNSSMV